MFRLLEMRIFKTDAERVRFTTRIEVFELRNAEVVNASDTGEPLVVCSWCGRVNIDNQVWRDVEIAIPQMRIFERAYLPTVSHGICPDCYANITDLLRTAD